VVQIDFEERRAPEGAVTRFVKTAVTSALLVEHRRANDKGKDKGHGSRVTALLFAMNATLFLTVIYAPGQPVGLTSLICLRARSWERIGHRKKLRKKP